MQLALFGEPRFGANREYQGNPPFRILSFYRSFWMSLEPSGALLACRVEHRSPRLNPCGSPVSNQIMLCRDHRLPIIFDASFQEFFCDGDGCGLGEKVRAQPAWVGT
jgi:hypothetical protein